MNFEPILGKSENKRAIRGYAMLLKTDESKQIEQNVFRASSQSSEKYYYVTSKNGEWRAPVQITNIGRLHVSTSML